MLTGERSSTTVSEDAATGDSSGPAKGLLDAVTAEKLQYIKRFNIHLIVDELIDATCKKRPKNPAGFMAEAMQKFLASDERKQLQPAGFKRLIHSLHRDVVEERAAARFPASEEYCESQCSIAKFGIWCYISRVSLPIISQRTLAQIQLQCQDVLTEFMDMDVLIQLLSHAALTEHFKGFDEAFKIIHLQSSNDMPTALGILTDVILDVVKVAPRTQQQDFIAFMKRMSFALSMASKGSHFLLLDSWSRVADAPMKFEKMRSKLTHELFMSEPLLGTVPGIANEYLSLLRRLLPVIGKRSVIKSEIWKFFLAMNEKGARVVPYLFVILGAHTLVVVSDLLGKDLSDAHIQAWCEALGQTVSVANEFLRDKYDSTSAAELVVPPSCVHFLFQLRRAPPLLFRDEEAYSGTLAEAFLRYSAYSDERAEEFLVLVKKYLDSSDALHENEGFHTRCSSMAYRELFKLLFTLVEHRHKISYAEALRLLFFRRCFGVKVSKLLLFFQDSLVGASSGADKVVSSDGVKGVLGVLQDLCVIATSTEVMLELVNTVDSVFESIELQQFYWRLADLLVIAGEMPFKKMLPRVDYLTQVRNICKSALVPGDAGDSYLHSCLVLGMHLKVTCIRMATTADFLNAAMLVACEQLNGKFPAWALNIVTSMMSCATQLAVHTPEIPSSLRDRSVLLEFYETHDLSRLFIAGAADMVALTPTLGKTLLHKPSYESAQKLFNSLYLNLLRSDVVDLTAMLQRVTFVHAVLGVQEVHFLRFAFSAMFMLRQMGFPELQWLAFFLGIMRFQVNFLRKMRDLGDYTESDIRKIILVQSLVRRWKVLMMIRKFRSQSDGELLEVLRSNDLVSFSFSSVLSSITSGDWSDDTIKITEKDKRIIPISWKAVSDKHMAIVADAISLPEYPLWDADEKETEQTCRSIVQNLSYIFSRFDHIGAVLSRFGTFAKVICNVVPEEGHHGFVRNLVNSILQYSSCGSHPGMRASWVAYLSFLIDAFNRHTTSNTMDDVNALPMYTV